MVCGPADGGPIGAVARADAAGTITGRSATTLAEHLTAAGASG